MKKTVIKRRKRVPAASDRLTMQQQQHSPSLGQGASRMTEQAAAETLVSVGRGPQDHSHGEESDEDDTE